MSEKNDNTSLPPMGDTSPAGQPAGLKDYPHKADFQTAADSGLNAEASPGASASDNGNTSGPSPSDFSNVATSQQSESLVVSVKVLYQTTVIVALVCSVLSIYIYHSFFALRVATMDLPGYMMNVRDAVANGVMSQEQVVAAVEAAADATKSVPDRYVLISGDVILGDAKRVLKVPLPAIKSSRYQGQAGQQQGGAPLLQQPGQGGAQGQPLNQPGGQPNILQQLQGNK